MAASIIIFLRKKNKHTQTKYQSGIWGLFASFVNPRERFKNTMSSKLLENNNGPPLKQVLNDIIFA